MITLTLQKTIRLTAALLLGALLAAAPAAARDEVTPELLENLLPAGLEGFELSWDESGLDPNGSAYAIREFVDPEDLMSGTDLAFNLAHLGPFADAFLLALEADAAAGRLERAELGDWPAFRGGDDDAPELHVIAGNIGVGTTSYGPVVDAEQLAAHVAGLPLDDIAALSELDAPAGANWSVPVLLQGELRSFLPETAAGLPRAPGFYSELHPAGSASSGFGYEGERDGQQLEIAVLIADSGSAAPRTREKLTADSGWDAFSDRGYDGFVRTGSGEPQALLFADRFRIEVSARPAILTADELKAVIAEVDPEPLLELARLLPETVISVDPLVDQQPALLDAAVLADVLPDTLGDLTLAGRGEQGTSQDGSWAHSVAEGMYADADGNETVLVSVNDEGVFSMDAQRSRGGMHPATVAGHDTWLHPDRPQVLLLVGGRIVVLALGAPDSGLDSAQLAELLEQLQFGPVLNAL